MKHLKAFERFFDLNDEIGQPETYDIVYEDDKPIAIHCKICDMTSYNVNDIEQKYCGNCHKFHDDMQMENFDHWSDSQKLRNTNDSSGVLENENDKIELTLDNIDTIPENDYVITAQDNELLNVYFKAEDGDDYISFDVTGKKICDAVKEICDDHDFISEWKEHVIMVLFPNKYEPMF